MADITVFDSDDSSRLICSESNDMCFDELDAGGSDAADPNGIPHAPDPIIIRVPEITDEIFALMLVREKEYLPKEDYLWRLRHGELEINFRREASDWIWKVGNAVRSCLIDRNFPPTLKFISLHKLKHHNLNQAHTHYSFGALSFCLSMNYLDRFLSLYDLHRDKAWAVQLLAVACLSIAVKMEETDVPPTIQLQVENPKFIFEAKTIQRMELLVLSTLNWHMSAITPCSFVEPFLSKIYDHNPIPMIMIDKSANLILATIRGLDFLRFNPSEVAAAVAISVAGEIQTVSIDKVISHSCLHLQKVSQTRVLECIELIKDMSLMSRCGEVGNGGNGGEESPNAVLEVGCFSHGSDDIANASQISLDNNTKRKRNQIFH